MLNLLLIEFLYQSDLVIIHCGTANLEHSASATFMVSVQVWHLWVTTFVYCLHSKYMSIIAASSYCLILYFLLWILVVGHNMLPCQWSFMPIFLFLVAILCLLCVSLFLLDFYLTVQSGGGSRRRHYHHHHHCYGYCCYICKVLSSDSMEQNPSVEVNKLLMFWLIHLLTFLQVLIF
jgi:hypothetical protein